MADAGDLIDLCSADAVQDGGTGCRFDLLADGMETTGFVIRHRGHVHGYVNRCAHVAMELDWQPGEFFDFDREFLVCATHGALYEPASGACIGGPCAGRGGLARLDVLERDGRIYWRPDTRAGALARG
jgi:nitrite reductase/ring-hydroxylating ferredoxin subunit